MAEYQNIRPASAGFFIGKNGKFYVFEGDKDIDEMRCADALLAIHVFSCYNASNARANKTTDAGDRYVSDFCGGG